MQCNVTRRPVFACARELTQTEAASYPFTARSLCGSSLESSLHDKTDSCLRSSGSAWTIATRSVARWLRKP